MLIRTKRSEKSQIEHELNMMHSPEGQARMAAAEELQADIQGSLSDEVREHGTLEDHQIAAWEDSLSEKFSDTQVTQKNTYNRRRYVAVDGKWVPTWDANELPALPKPKCFRPLFEPKDAE